MRRRISKSFEGFLSKADMDMDMDFALTSDQRRELVHLSSAMVPSEPDDTVEITVELLHDDFFGSDTTTSTRPTETTPEYQALSSVYKGLLDVPYPAMLPDGHLQMLHDKLVAMAHRSRRRRGLHPSKIQRLCEYVADTIHHLQPLVDVIHLYDTLAHLPTPTPPVPRAWLVAACKRFRRALPQLRQADVTGLFDAHVPQNMDTILHEARVVTQVFAKTQPPFRAKAREVLRARAPPSIYPSQPAIQNTPSSWSDTEPPPGLVHEWGVHQHHDIKTMDDVWRDVIQKQALACVRQQDFDPDQVVSFYHRLYKTGHHHYPKTWDFSSQLLAMATYQVYADASVTLGLPVQRFAESRFFDKRIPETLVPQPWAWMPPPLVPRQCAEAAALCKDLVLTHTQDPVLAPTWVDSLAPLACLARDLTMADAFYRRFCQVDKSSCPS